MTPQARIDHMAQGLIRARQRGQTWAPDPAAEGLTLEEAYAVQARVAAAMGWFPDGPCAWKAGGAPVVSGAPLPAVLASPACWSPAAEPDGHPGEWIVEAELAFRLRRAPTGPDLAADVVQALDTVAVSIELIDTRLASGLAGSPASWKLADQGVHGALVVGAEVAAGTVARFGREDWQGQAWSIRVNDAPVQQGRGGLPAVDPLTAICWLAGHAAVHTGGLRAGDLVTTGAWGLVRARRGDRVDIVFDGIGQASVTLSA